MTKDKNSWVVSSEIPNKKSVITAKTSTPGNSTSNTKLKRIRQVIENLVRTYNIKDNHVDEDDPQSGILAAPAFAIFPTEDRLKGYSPGQSVFGRDMIIPIKHKADWELIRQRNHRQINKIISAKIIKESTITIKSEINSYSIIMLYINMKCHIRDHL